jgi:Flp pilus assembly protein TadG
MRRRGVTAVLVVVALVVLLGFASLTVDVGAMYNARNDLQRAADSAALAAAARLGDFEQGDPVVLARAEAGAYTQMNEVLGRTMTLDSNADVTFLRADYNQAANTYTFTPTEVMPDAVRVRVRMTEGSPNGPLPLFFAGIFGILSTDVSASATASVIPRDIAIAADLSASHNDDSELQHYQSTSINLYDVWNALPGGANEDGSVWNPAEVPADLAQAAGPGWGYMKKMGYGTMNIDSAYNPVADTGLVRLAYAQSWSNAQLTTYLTNQGYNSAECTAIMTNSASDSSTVYPLRVSVALGLATWNSGIAGGRWSTHGQPAGNGNTAISASETVWAEQIMGRSLSSSATIWTDYINNYVRQSSTEMYAANANFRYRYGVKTFANYLLEFRPQNNQTPELANTPTQPMQAVKDSVRHLMDVLVGLGTEDHVSLEVYGQTARHEINLTNNFYQVSDRLNQMQAAHYDRNTNMGGGIQRAIEELSSVRARSTSRKTIIVLTDGLANVTETGAFSYSGGAAYALQKAQEAADMGFRIFAVSVGTEPDLNLMNQIAEIGTGEHFHAEGSIEQYSAQLDSIFATLGGRRPIQLVE